MSDSAAQGAEPDLVTVVVVTYSPGEHLSRFLSTLRSATNRPLRIVLADNGSTDGVPEATAAAADDVAFLPTGGNLGYGLGANVGAREAATGWLVVANPDVAWKPGALDTLIAAADRWPRGAAFGPALLTEDGSLYPSARALPSLGRGTGHALLGWWWPTNPWTRAYRHESGTPVEGPVGWLSGSCLLLRRDAFASVNGFDPSYFMYFEDLDLCERLERAGWLCVYVPSAVCGHEGGHATAKVSHLMVAEHHRSAYRYLSRKYPGRRGLPVRVLLRLGLLARRYASYGVGSLREGARPTREADVLDDV
ncbi:MAG: glycosyltransferase family 2 protein [Mycobacteriales bacterium]